MNILKYLKQLFFRFKNEREYRKKIKILKKRDPFTYKNF